MGEPGGVGAADIRAAAGARMGKRGQTMVAAERHPCL